VQQISLQYLNLIKKYMCLNLKVIFFQMNNSTQQETTDAGTPLCPHLISNVLVELMKTL